MLFFLPFEWFSCYTVSEDCYHGCHVIQFLKTAIKNVVHAADINYCIILFHPSRIYSNRNNTIYHDHCT